MFAGRYWGSRYYGRSYWPSGSSVPSAPGLYWGPSYYGASYWGPRYWPGGAGVVIPDLPDSLLAAIKIYWADNNLATAIAPLYAFTPFGAVPPFVLITKLEQVIPGVSQDDIPVEMFLSIWDRDGDDLNAKRRLIEDHFGDSTVEAQAIEREQFEWTEGREIYAERNMQSVRFRPKTYVTGNVYVCDLHYTFWIEGRM